MIRPVIHNRQVSSACGGLGPGGTRNVPVCVGFFSPDKSGFQNPTYNKIATDALQQI